MNFNNILHEIAETNPEVYEQKSGRRSLLKSFGSKVAVAATPFVVGALLGNKAQAKTTAASDVVAALDFLLEIEYFQYNFYHSGLATGNSSTVTLIPAADIPGFQMIQAHQKAHITFLRKTIDGLAAVPFTPHLYAGDPLLGDPYSPPSYDFTAHNSFQVYQDYNVFLMVAQAFEDMVVRAYQGQLSNFLANTNDILTQVLEMSTVEARHASYVRKLRRDRGAVEVCKPWITNNVPPSITLKDFYLQEDNVIQKGFDVTQLPGYTGTISASAASEAFDEPLDKTTVEALIAPFKL
jgi:hypothetical protein